MSASRGNGCGRRSSIESRRCQRVDGFCTSAGGLANALRLREVARTGATNADADADADADGNADADADADADGNADADGGSGVITIGFAGGVSTIGVGFAFRSGGGGAAAGARFIAGVNNTGLIAGSDGAAFGAGVTRRRGVVGRSASSSSNETSRCAASSRRASSHVGSICKHACSCATAVSVCRCAISARASKSRKVTHLGDAASCSWQNEIASA
jgi:hypothetical protein